MRVVKGAKDDLSEGSLLDFSCSARHNAALQYRLTHLHLMVILSNKQIWYSQLHRKKPSNFDTGVA